MDLIERLLIHKGEQVIIKESGYRGAIQAFSNAGARLIKCNVDNKGIDLDKIRPRIKTNFEGNTNALLIYTTPSH